MINPASFSSDDFPSFFFSQKGSFYELFGDDAREVSQRLPLRRSETTGMVGFPVHRAAHWIPVFVQAGFTLTVADQVRLADPADPDK